MTIQESKEAIIKRCVCFCALCVEEWLGNKRKHWEMHTATAICVICGSFLCEIHSLYEFDAEICRCRDRSACRSVASDQDEGGGD